MLEQPMPEQVNTGESFSFNHSLCFDNVSFRCASNSEIVVDNMLSNFKGQSILWKKYCYGLIMGLLQPTSGSIYLIVDLHEKKIQAISS